MSEWETDVEVLGAIAISSESKVFFGVNILRLFQVYITQGDLINDIEEIIFLIYFWVEPLAIYLPVRLFGRKCIFHIYFPKV